ncbi:TPA: hypothetical protein N0F65_003412, partial [Lagenidium giganteum]
SLAAKALLPLLSHEVVLRGTGQAAGRLGRSVARSQRDLQRVCLSRDLPSSSTRSANSIQIPTPPTMAPATSNTLMLPNEPKVAAYFDALIRNQLEGAPIQCGYAGEAKGKAIYAAKALVAGEPVWTEKPFVAMQHEISRDFIDSCEHCFVSLINTKEEWERVVKACQEDSVEVTEKDLDEAVEYLQKEGGKSAEDSYFSVFKQAEHHVICECGAVFCSEKCKKAADEEYHALVCTNAENNETPMGQFVNHTLATNEIFQLAAKVIAKVMMRFVSSHDLAHAREPVDMFCKKPWWEVISSEEDLEEGQTMEEYQQCFKDLLSQTLDLFKAGLADNLARMEKADALNGLSAETVLSSCDELLTPDYFANVVGMFEMNNISMEIDHPFHALAEALNEEKEDNTEDPAVLTRVNKALSLYAEKYETPKCLEGCCGGEDGEHDHDHAHDHAHEHEGEDDDEEDEDEEDLEQGFYGVDGTALFSGICTMNHSCDPNCTVLYTKDGSAHVFAVKDIQEGEELTISYIDVDQDRADRHECLRSMEAATTTTTSPSHSRMAPPRAVAARATAGNRHSCVAAPYAPNEPRTARYFEVVISKAKAPVVCGFAGKVKGKAIYADCDIPGATRIWTESPFVAMQHEKNQHHVKCCQYCFVPLVGDYRQLWESMVAKWHARNRAGATTIEAVSANGERTSSQMAYLEEAMRDVQVGDLDYVVDKLELSRHNCGLVTPTHVCVCGAAFCSRLCQAKANHEFHAILCPGQDEFNSMHEFLRHVQWTNEIFILAAKVIARILARFIATRDLEKAREPIDMFYKKPWWEVVVVEKHYQHAGDSAMNGSAKTHGAANGDMTHPPAHVAQQSLRELLHTTHELLLDALECNLVRMEREDLLNGLSVDQIWTNCESVLSFEFFAALLGLFEMNNISLEVDHPFRALVDILEPDGHNEDPQRGSSVPPKGHAQNHRSTPTQQALFDACESDPTLRRVRALLELEDSELKEMPRSEVSSPSSSLSSSESSDSHNGFQGVEGTALFPIICTMNHSCDPNCTALYTKDGDAHVVAVRDIKRGEELCICYIDIDQDVAKREEHLREYQFKCFCARCAEERVVENSNSPNGERNQIESRCSKETKTGDVDKGHAAEQQVQS